MERQRILDAIRDCAARDGSTTVGQARFIAVTGIGPRDWGRFWPRWSDAVREAGLQPGRWNKAYDDGYLFEHFIALARSLGRVPVSRELRLKARSDPSFPSHNTFNRIGSKRELVARVRKYCQGRAGYEDALALCSARDDREEPADSGSEGERGIVYLERHGQRREYKIGRANALGRRERELGIQLPDKLTRIHAIETDDPAGVEAYWHRRLASKRGNGEWFCLDAADVRAFKRWKKIL